VPHPDSRIFELYQNRIALPRGDIDGVRKVGVVEWNPILGEYQLGELMQMHRMDLETLVVVMDDQPGDSIGTKGPKRVRRGRLPAPVSWVWRVS